MATNEFLIIGACNVIFIIITITLIFVPLDESKDFGSTELIAILSMLWCSINSFLAFQFLKSKPIDSNDSNLNKDYLQSSDHSLHHNHNAFGTHKTNRNSDENVQILIKDKDSDHLHTKSEDVLAENGEIELENIKIKLVQEEDKLSKQHTKCRELEYENKQILDEYKRYKQENNETSKDNLMLIENCKQFKLQNDALQKNVKEKEEENESLTQTISEKEEEINSSKQQIESMQAELENMEQITSELNAFKANSEIIKKQIDEYEERINELQAKEANLAQENEELIESIDSLKEQHTKQIQEIEQNISNDASAAVHNENIEKLKKELAHAQKTIIEMTSVVGVQQKFPTVQETIQQFRSIRDQKHHDASTLLKKFIKSKSENKWQKYFINQTVHEIMFDILIECYRCNELYRFQIYDEIGDILNMKYAIAQAFEIDDSNLENNEIIQKQQMKILSNIFGSYFKTNFKYVLEKRLFAQTNDDDEKEKKNNSQNGDLVDEILQFAMKKHAEYLTDANEEVINGLKEYIMECCHVCWVMILQDPPLNIKPSQWFHDDESIAYDETYHKRVLGSDRKCKNILYYVWPAVARNNIILGDQKIDVILKDDLYQRLKEKKKA